MPKLELSYFLAVLNVGSASQLGVIKPAQVTSCAPLPPSVMEVPYFNTDLLLVAASLTGANILSTLVETLKGWMRELNIGAEDIPSDAQLYERLVSLAEDKLDTSLSVQVTLWGERYDPGQAGAVANMNPRNLSLGDVSSAVFRGIVENLQTMMPDEIFQSLKVTSFYMYTIHRLWSENRIMALLSYPWLHTCTVW